MRSLALLAVAMMVLAGCTQPGGEPADQVAARIVFDERGTYYVGDLVIFQAQATRDVTGWTWDMGDGTEATGARVVHAFRAAGTFDVRATAVDDEGRRITASTQIELLDLFGPGRPRAPPGGNNSGDLRLRLADGEPVTGQPFAWVLEGPAPSTAGTLTVWIDDLPQEHVVEGLPARIEAPGLAAGAHRVPWMLESDGQFSSGALEFDVWGIPIQFGAPTAQQWLRPGVHSEVCTVNFLFHYKWYRFFIGSAAHCIDTLGLSEVCQAEPTGKIGNKERLSAHDGRSTGDAWVAYNAWLTMKRVGASAGACAGNDFALIELGPEAQKVMHPAAMYFQGPTKLAAGGYGMGTTLYGYGASELHGNAGYGYPGQEAVNAKRGVSLGTANEGYSQHMYFALPGVPGDSGGPAFGPGGEALGAASTVHYAPFTGSNHYTVVPKALEYMLQHEGWAPELVTYDGWRTI